MLTLSPYRQFNGGSPWNVPAGHGSINLDQVIEKYTRERDEAEATKLQQIRENKVPSEHPYQPVVRNAPTS